MNIRFTSILSVSLFLLLSSCEVKRGEDKLSSLIQSDSRIVSLNGTITEIICVMGFEKNIVGVDVTSTYPQRMLELPKVGHNRNLSSEGIISLHPDLVIGFKDEIKPEVAEQIKAAGIPVLFAERDLTVKGSENLITEIADTLGFSHKGDSIVREIRTLLTKIKPFKVAPKVLFIYARGAGTLMVAGENTSQEEMIELAGGTNAAKGFENFKPLTAESLVAANPDVILMFSSGLESLEGEKGLQLIPGLPQTNAGKKGAIIAMDGQYLSGMGPRLGQAALELNKRLHHLSSDSTLLTAK